MDFCWIDFLIRTSVAPCALLQVKRGRRNENVVLVIGHIYIYIFFFLYEKITRKINVFFFLGRMKKDSDSTD